MRFATLVSALGGFAGLAWAKDDSISREKSPDGEDIKSIAVSWPAWMLEGRTTEGPGLGEEANIQV
jgi:hypothetical protein